MTFRFAVAVSLLFLLIQTQPSFGQNEAARASKTWEVRKFEVIVTLPQPDSERTVSASATLSLTNVSASNAAGVTLRISPQAEVSSVKINGGATDFTKGEEKTGAGSLQRIIVRGLMVPTGAGLQVEVSYRIRVDENSGLAAISPVTSQFLPLSFWYPTPTSWYFARGGDFAPVTIRVNGVGTSTVIAPGKSVGGVHSETALNLQPFFLTGSWETVQAAGVEAFVQSGASESEKERAKEIAAYASEARNYFSKLLGDLPETNFRIVAVRRGGGFSGGGVILLDQSAFRRKKVDSQTAVVVADAVAKTWLGGAAQVSGDGYSVIREGLARYLATQFIEQRFGAEVADVERLRQRLAYGTVAKRDGAITQISPIDDFYATSMTSKGAIIWRQVVRDVGADRFFGIFKSAIRSGRLDLASIRQSLPDQKVFLDYAFDQVTDGNILVGLPRSEGGVTRVALRNTGPIDVTVNVRASLAGGGSLTAVATVPSKSFGEAEFRTSSQIAAVEVDPEKYFLQQDYSDDVAPRRFSESDFVLLVKSSFDKQDFTSAEKDAREILTEFPHFDDVRTLLARSLLAAGKVSDAEREFRILEAEKLPSARTLAWTEVGLGEIAARAGRGSEALERFESGIRADAELGATFAGRKGRNQLGLAAKIDQSIGDFFAIFDKAAVSNRKSEVDALIVPGEMAKFSKGLAGQAQEWTSLVRHVDMFGPDSALVEVDVSLRLINKNAESGPVTYRMHKVGGAWRLSGVETFEVR